MGHREALPLAHEALPPGLRSEVGPALPRRLFAPVEWLFRRLEHSQPVPGSRGTFLVACRRYRGRPVSLPDGVTIRHGDRVAEIHFWNERFAQREATDTRSLTWSVMRDLRADLGCLAEAMRDGSVAAGVRAVYGASPIAAAAARFGFTVRPLPPGLRRTALTLWQRRLRRAFRPLAARADTRADTTEMWMSADAFLRRFADGARHPQPPTVR